MPFVAGGGGAAGTSPFLLSGTDIIYDPTAALVVRTKLGIADSATPLSQTLFVAGSRGGTDVDIAGGNLTILPGLGTGIAAASSLIFQTPTVGVTGSVQQVAATRLTIATAAITATVPVLLSSGSAALPSLAFSSFTTLGMHALNATFIGLGIGGVGKWAFSEGAGVQYFVSLPTGLVGWTATTYSAGPDTIISRGGIATLQLGAAAAAAPVSQTLRAQGSRGGTDVDIAGGNLTILSGLGTGIAAASSLIFQTPTVGVTGSVQQVAATRLTIATAAITTAVPLITATQNALQVGPYGAGAGNTGEVRFLELAAGGTNYTAFKAADALAQTTTYILPSTDPTVGQILSSSAPAAGICTLSWIAAAGSSPIQADAVITTKIVYTAASVAAGIVTFQLGGTNGAPVTNQTLQGMGALAGTDADTAGGTLTIDSGQGTGTGAVSSLIFRTPTVVGAGSGAQTMATRLTIATAAVTLASALPLNWSTDIGLVRNAAGVLALTDGSTGGGTLFLASAQQVKWSSTTTFGAADVGLRRQVAGQLTVSNGGAGTGSLGTTSGTATVAALGQSGALTTGITWASGVNFTISGVYAFLFRSFGLRAGSGYVLGWSSNVDPTFAVTDAGFNWVGAGIVALNTGTVGTYGQLNLIRVLAGNGPSSAAPTVGRISGTAGLGTDIAGGALRMEPGAGTGTGLGGAIIFQFAPAAAGTGAVANTLQEAGRFAAGGVAGADQYVGLFLGSGHKTATLGAGYLAAPEAAGTDITGIALNVRGGASTGTGKGGAIIFGVTPAAPGTGSAVNTFQVAGQFDAQGSGGGEIVGLVLGGGHKGAAPGIGVLMGAQGAGTDIAGGILWVRGGAGSGSGTPGNILFEVSTAGGTGTTVQAYATRMTVSPASVETTVPVYHPGTFASIYCKDASTAQGSLGTTPVKLTAFTTNGESNNCTPDAANDKITVVKTGTYRVTLNSSFTGTNAAIVQMWVRVAGAESIVGFTRTLGAAAATESASGEGFLNLTAAQDVDVYLETDNAGGGDSVTVSSITLTLEYVGA